MADGFVDLDGGCQVPRFAKRSQRPEPHDTTPCLRESSGLSQVRQSKFNKLASHRRPECGGQQGRAGTRRAAGGGCCRRPPRPTWASRRRNGGCGGKRAGGGGPSMTWRARSAWAHAPQQNNKTLTYILCACCFSVRACHVPIAHRPRSRASSSSILSTSRSALCAAGRARGRARRVASRQGLESPLPRSGR